MLMKLGKLISFPDIVNETKIQLGGIFNCSLRYNFVESETLKI